MTRAVLSAMIAAVMIAGVQPAQGATETATPKTVYARYIIDSCPPEKRSENDYCSPWRLRLRDGRFIRLPDAVFAFPPRPPLLSPHGSQVSYYRTDGALAVLDLTTGKARAVPGNWTPQSAPLLQLSPGGRFVTVDKPYRIVDTVTGQAHALPFVPEGDVSFSPDNRYVLTHREILPLASRDPGVTEVFSTATWTVMHRGTQRGALHMGGSIVAYTDGYAGETHYIRFLNLATGAPARSPIKIPDIESAVGLVWDQADHLDILTHFPAKYHRGIKLRQDGYRWRRANGGMRILDTFTRDRRAMRIVQGSLS